jgi:hypothetical protein
MGNEVETNEQEAHNPLQDGKRIYSHLLEGQGLVRRQAAGNPGRFESLLLDIPHRQVVLTVPKTLRIFFKYRRRLLGELCRAAVKTLTVYFEALAGETLIPGVVVAVQTFGDRINFHPLCGASHNGWRLIRSPNV